MSSSAATIYCLDANVLIQAWRTYYAPKFCPSYWEILNSLGASGKIFIPQLVHEEITRTEDDLCEWLKGSSIPVHGITEAVTKSLQAVYAANPVHATLVDSIKGRSLADPWVIAHAITVGATVVTKEIKLTADATKRVRIPNVCENMSVRCIDDFEFIAEVNLKFSCTL